MLDFVLSVFPKNMFRYNIYILFTLLYYCQFILYRVTVFRSFLIITLRNLFKQKGYFVLNTLGLTIGLISFIFIFQYVIHELNYDKFHSKHERIYRVIIKGKMSGQVINQAITAAPTAEAMLKDYPEVESIVRLTRQGAWLLQYGEARYNEEKIMFADSTLFEVFDFSLIKGDPSTCLKEPRSLVMSESTALKYFGYDNPIGKAILILTLISWHRLTLYRDPIAPTGSAIIIIPTWCLKKGQILFFLSKRWIRWLPNI